MRQMYDLDNVILSKILDNSLKIDIEKGMIFGVRCDVSGNRLPVGRIDKRSGHILFSLVHNNMSRSYYVCRAVYLSVYGKIPDGYIITHINNDIKNNCINNLHLSIPVENSAANNNCGRGRWTVEEESFLIENYGNLSYNELTLALNRSDRSIRTKIKKLGVINKASKRRRWVNSDDDRLVSLYKSGKFSIKELASIMNRSENSIRIRANRILNAYRSDSHLRALYRSKNFYAALKRANQRNSLWMKCCMCDYDKYIDLHHIDENRHNNSIVNIATLCPNHHTEVTHGDHSGVFLYSIWRRIYSDGSYGKIYDNKRIIVKK